jgi:pimeloyl-ACP methyl ester carboxylesterase
MPAAQRYGELRRLPVSIVAGAEDQIVDVGRHSARLHRAVPGSDLHVVPGLGHMVHYGAPGLIAEAIDAVASAAAQRSAIGALGSALGRARTAPVPEHV